MFLYIFKCNYKCTIYGKLKIFAAIISVGFIVSCTKFLEVDAPNDKLESSNAFQDSVSASSTLTGIYSKLMEGNNGFMGYKSVLPALEADELIYTGSNNTLLEYLNNNIQVNNSMVSAIWTEMYGNIYRCNSTIEGVTKSNGISPSAKTKLKAEALFIRAFCYFYLVNNFGPVPLILETTYPNSAQASRSDVQEVYKQIISDLVTAKAGLPDVYPTLDRARPNKWAATALLSRSYLYTKDYSSAESEASSIIQRTDLYNINPDLNLVFKKESSETIWQLAPVTSIFNSFDGALFIGSSGNIPPYVLTPELYNAFSSGDKRKSFWIASQVIGANTYYYPNKYKVKSGSAGSIIEYEIVFRLSEQYLIRAEARAMQNKLIGANSASSDINAVRFRAGLNDITATTQEAILLVLEAEKRCEYFAEWGHRWLDIKRWPSIANAGSSRADDILAPVKGSNWQATDVLYPIPADQIRLNGNLTQNDGYTK
ncbi:RagB/SusD family nutrient uptake outer membrane protein [Filimonas effusa]|uniref:RagB/SusD family nutrient uptake outer membrane protein n=1 Tax=Filimonas effusa TaxID=2508721 RepID=A0A4Q1D3E4_9BACT|nr:RagB/SusD family nutrient uptake outer membrane protein [Filimonas effusa]RXK81683.1 RagB/SusD family nutrient uptake outer membrane protein [Filimonas effusa]